MGNSESKQVPFKRWSKDDVAESVVSLGGPKYKEYATSIRDSGIDGGLLTSLEDAEELNEMLDELEISSKIHRKVLTRAWESAALTRETEEEEEEKQESSTSQEHHLPPSDFFSVDEGSESTRAFVDIPDFEAAEKYGIGAFSSKEELEVFDTLSEKLINANPHAIYAGVHLCRRDGQHILSGHIRGSDGQCNPIDHLVTDHNRSLCSKLVRDRSKDFMVREVPSELSSLGKTYVGYVIKNGNGDRVGAVCQVINDTVEEGEQDDSLKKISAEIAAMTAEQFRLREQLQARNASLTQQVENAKKEYQGLKAKQEEREIVHEEEKERSERIVDDSITMHEYPSLPFINSSNLASKAEQEHIPKSVIDEALEIGLPVPPVGKDDMARVARVEALGLHNMDPDSPMAKQLRGMISRASSLFGFPFATLTIQNHLNQFGIGIQDSNLGVIETGQTISRDRDGKPFCVAYGRGLSVCNYTMLKRKTLFIPDYSEHENFKNYKFPLRSYVGTPLITSDGYVVATFCMMDLKPRHDFTEAHQLEFEKLALLAVQSIENWEHRRMMETLVEERKRLEQLSSSMRSMQSSSSLIKREAPKGNVTIVLTDIEGSTSLWEADSQAMKEALILHDAILRKAISKHSGYEIKTEGDAFHVAFHDPVDAISFALEVQVELFHAAWSENILALPHAEIDSEGMFRGLRVRMGVHSGSSVSQVNQVSGRASYSGETFRLAKSIEALCYGGQILTSAETWRCVAELMEQLGNPQVVDYGEYVLMTGENIDEGIIAKGVVQLVPKKLAHDYYNATGSSSGQGSLMSSMIKGRKFPQADTAKRLTTSFLDAPYIDGRVTMMFVYPFGTDDFSEDLADRTFSVLTKL